MLCFFSLPQRSKFSIKNPPIRRRKGLAGICRRILISLAAGSFFLSACAAEETKSGESLYINLNEYTAYLKDGFNQEDITGPPDLSPNSWRIIEERTGNKKRTIQIRYSGLMSIPYRTFLSPLGEKDREYTLLIPFTINREQFEILKGDNAFQPGIFLAALGDNWEIFLNGKKVKSEVYLDQEGQIRSHRSRRSVFFSLDKSLFAQGSNLLAFRILGAPDYNKTGLFYHAPYYIGDYGQIARKNNESLLIAQCGIYIFIGFYHLLLFFPRRQERYNLYYGIFSVLLGIYVFLRTHAGLPVIPDSAVLLRLEYGCFCMIMPMMSAFLESLNFKKISLGNKIYGTCCLFLALSQGIFSLPYGEDALFLAWRLVPCGIVYVFVYDIGYAFFCLVHKKWKEDKNVPLIKNLWVSIISTPQGNILIGALFFLVVGFLNIVYGLKSQAGTIHYINHGFFAFTIITTLILVRRFGNLFSRLDYMNNTLELINANLENTVKERTRDLEQQTRRAESASRAKSAFLARMSHEIRTPMNAVIGMSELALREEARPHLMIEYVQDIKQAGISLLAIINDILDFSKIETGNLEIVPGSYSLSTLINDVINLVRVRITEKGLIFMVDAEASLPERLHGDEVRIRQILLNLLSNAAKYTHQGYVNLTVTGSPMTEGNFTLYFAVTDSGIGIRTEDTELLFGDFIRLDPGQNKAIEGTGLGLSITRNLCRMMGGDVSVSSEYGTGSVFTAHIIQKCTDSGKFAIVENPDKKRTLLIYEQRIYAESVRVTLENLGISVTMCGAGEDYFRELETGSYGFAFFSANFMADTIRRIEGLSLKTTAVLLDEFERTSIVKDTLRILMPAYATPVANILNGLILPERRMSDRIRFIAPRAHILLVDDIAINLKVAEGLLMLYQIRVDTAAGGLKAIELVQRHDYDIVFMDHMMPEMDGIEATVRIRELGGRYRELPIIALTANVVSGMQELFLAKGFNDCLAKPIEMSRLDTILRSWIPAEKREMVPIRNTQPLQESAAGTIPDVKSRGLMIEGLDTARGIITTGGSEAAYREILALYCRDATERLDILRQVPDEAGLPLFTTQVHALKTASASIGAMSLSEEAAMLERAGKAGDRGFIADHLDQFRKALISLTGMIRKALDPEAGEGDDGAAAPAELDRTLFTRLRDALKGENIGTIDSLLDELKGKVPDPETAKILGAIADSVLVSDFKEAIELIDALL
ncbi:MAG: response regulator [Treponema sp.]|jgi:signal transduction histidine kinase/CheY-like chemotaxis protein|nr:response regulator [Treponema sp.]